MRRNHCSQFELHPFLSNVLLCQYFTSRYDIQADLSVNLLRLCLPGPRPEFTQKDVCRAPLPSPWIKPSILPSSVTSFPSSKARNRSRRSQWGEDLKAPFWRVDAVAWGTSTGCTPSGHRRHLDNGNLGCLGHRSEHGRINGQFIRSMTGLMGEFIRSLLLHIRFKYPGRLPLLTD